MARERKTLEILGDRVEEQTMLTYHDEGCGFRLFSGASSTYDKYKEAHDEQQKRYEENGDARRAAQERFFGQDRNGDYPYTIRKRKDEFLFSFTSKRRMTTTREDTCGHAYPCKTYACATFQERQKAQQEICDAFRDRINDTYNDHANGWKTRQALENERQQQIMALHKVPATEEDLFIGETEFDHEFTQLALRTKIIY